MYLPKINSVTEKYSNYILLLWLNLLLLQITSFTHSMYLNGRIISLEIIVKIFLVKYKWRIFLKLIPHLHLPQLFMAEMIMAKMTVIHLSVCIYLSVMFFFLVHSMFSCSSLDEFQCFVSLKQFYITKFQSHDFLIMTKHWNRCEDCSSVTVWWVYNPNFSTLSISLFFSALKMII